MNSLKKQLKEEIVSQFDLGKALSWLRIHGYVQNDGRFEKGLNTVILDSEGIYVKKGNYTEDGCSLKEMIQLLQPK